MKKIALNPQKHFFCGFTARILKRIAHIFGQISTSIYVYDNRGPPNPSEFDNPLPEPTEPTVCQYGSAEPTRTDPLVHHYSILEIYFNGIFILLEKNF